MPRLRVLVGESPSSLHPISANDPAGHTLKTPRFEGSISVFLKDFENEKGMFSTGEEYFGTGERPGVTWSIQARGRFLTELNADDVLFGNVFDRPLPLPYGSGAAIKFMHLRDPTLEDDLHGEKPWALSPLITTMPYLSIQDINTTNGESNAPGSGEGSPGLLICESVKSILPPTVGTEPQARRSYFKDPAKRQAVTFTPTQHIACDFCHGWLSFSNRGESGSGTSAGSGLSLNFPMVEFDLMKYWDGRPVWFVCCERNKEQGIGPGAMIWCVGFEIVEAEEKAVTGDEQRQGNDEDSKPKDMLQKISRKMGMKD
ncbi:hypothetical protein DL93DRAFT_118506 [Clavulina sp. PMI_390]|nr:hypothetical protein DL93DRAFT_118506 [Clavulina sp. PMI_390]